jgi:hypothetical protein
MMLRNIDHKLSHDHIRLPIVRFISKSSCGRYSLTFAPNGHRRAYSRAKANG